MYRCNRCEATFSEPLPVIDGEKSMHSDHYEVLDEICPVCGAVDIDEVNACLICGEATQDTDHQFCEDCHENLAICLKTLSEEMGIEEQKLNEFIDEHFGW